jgi:hypothetical protein
MSDPAGTSTTDPTATQAGIDNGSDEPSAPTQVKEKVQEGAVAVRDKADELKSSARERVRLELDTRSTEVGSHLQGTAAAMRRTTEQLRGEGKQEPANAVEFVAEQADRFGAYLTASNADALIRDVEAFARRKPWLAALGGATVGFFASRFLKASSSSRFQASASHGAQAPWQPASDLDHRPSLSRSEAVGAHGAAELVTAERGRGNG